MDELEQLKRDNEVLYRDNVALSETADRLREALENLLRYAERQTCMHEETHRAGTIWEICDMCGRRWADDRGGKPEYEEPEAFTNAHALLNGREP